MRHKIIGTFLVASTLVFASCSIGKDTGGNTPTPSTEVPVTGVLITPKNATMKVGETQNFIATVSPNDATNKDVTWSVSDTSKGRITTDGVFTALKEGSCTVIVSTKDGGHIDTSNITINPQDAPVTLSEIRLSGDYKTSFHSGEEFTASGLIVTAYYTNGDYEQVFRYSVSTPSTTLNEDETSRTETVTVSYTEDGITVKRTYDITITEKIATKVTVIGEGQYEFEAGDEFNHDGIGLLATYSDGTTGEVNPTSFSSPDMNQLGPQGVTVYYFNGEETLQDGYTITIYAPQASEIVGIRLGGDYQTTFFVGDDFTNAGMDVYAVYDDGSESLWNTGYSITDPDMSTAGTRKITVTVTYEGQKFSASYTITIYPKESGDSIYDLNCGIPYESGEYDIKGTVSCAWYDSYGNYNFYMQNTVDDKTGGVYVYKSQSIIEEGSYIEIKGNKAEYVFYRNQPEINGNNNPTITVLKSASENPYTVTPIEYTADNFVGYNDTTSENFVDGTYRGPIEVLIKEVTVQSIAGSYTAYVKFSNGQLAPIYYGSNESTEVNAIDSLLSSYMNNGKKLDIIGHPHSSTYSNTLQLAVKHVGYITESENQDVPPVDDKIKTFTIGATNDFHGHIDEEASSLGLSRMGNLIKTFTDKDNTLVLSQGDDWQGSIYSNFNYGNLVNDVYAEAKLSARTIGNHDFDWGVEKLKINTARSYNGYRTPVLAANVYDYDHVNRVVGEIQQSDIGVPTISYTLENGLKVGIVGVIGKSQITSITSSYVTDICFTNHVNVIKEKATELRNDGCDIVIASCHTGQEEVLGNNLSNYVDLVLCGHSHKEESTSEDGLFYSQCGAYGKNFASIQLEYNTETKDVTLSSYNLIGATNYNSYVTSYDTTIDDIIAEFKTECETEASEILACNVSGDFGPKKEAGNMVCKAIYDQCVEEGHGDVVLTYVNQARVGLYKSQWTYADIYESYPFDNIVCIEQVKGSDILYEVKGWGNAYFNLLLRKGYRFL